MRGYPLYPSDEIWDLRELVEQGERKHPNHAAFRVRRGERDEDISYRRFAQEVERLVSALAGLLMLALLAFGGFALWQDAALRRGAFVCAELLQYKPAAPAADNPTLAGLQTVNPDVCGWLTVDGTGIDYPVVQGATNMDYVNRDVYGDFSLSGAIFLDSRCAADLTDPYTVIYGHHMDNSAMSVSYTHLTLPTT